MLYGGGTAQVYHETDVPSWHPFLPQFWNGTCDEGQLTAEGLADAAKHGQVSLMKAFQGKRELIQVINSAGLLVCLS